jgi:hypothetical protein
VADIDAELERGGGDHRRRCARFQSLLRIETLLLSEAAVMRDNSRLATSVRGSRGRRSSAFVRKRFASINARSQPELSRLAGCVLSAPLRATWETTHGP